MSPDFLEQALGWQERSIGDASDHQSPRLAVEPYAMPLHGHRTHGTGVTGAQHAPCGYFRSDGVHSRSDEVTAGHRCPRGRRARRRLRRFAAPGRGRADRLVPLEVADATFPSIAVDRRELDDGGRRSATPTRRPRPNVAVTVETDPAKAGSGTVAFGQRVDDDRLSDPERPVWVVDEGPQGGDSAATNTWSLGRLEAGATKTFRWKVTAVQPGSYTIKYRVSPGLNGKAKLGRPGRRLLQGQDRRQARARARERHGRGRPRRSAGRVEVALSAGAIPMRRSPRSARAGAAR